MLMPVLLLVIFVILPISLLTWMVFKLPEVLPETPPIEPVLHQPVRVAVEHATCSQTALVSENTDIPTPVGHYLRWPAPTVAALFILGLLGAFFGAGGSPEGFAVCYALNPLNWAMLWAFFMIGKIQCPHCRRALGGNSVRNAAIGTSLHCPGCTNNFNKP